MFLVVVQDFARWVRGEAITAVDEIEHALAHHPEKVVRVGADAAPAVSPVAASATAIEEK